jgi:prophage regulatory protein
MGRHREERDARSTRTPRVEARFLTLDDVATYLNVGVPQVYTLVRNGDLPAIKIGNRGVWRVDRGELEAYVDRLHAENRERVKAHGRDPAP